MPDDFDKILDEAERLTQKQLSAQISSLTRLKDSEINSLFPTKHDKENLVRLMQIVRGSTSENRKRKELIDNISTVANTVIKLLNRLTIVVLFITIRATL